jgi:hypothetical protein
MTMPPTKLLVAWALGVLLVSGSVPGQAAAPVTTSPKGQVSFKPNMRPPAFGLANVMAAPAPTAAATPSGSESGSGSGSPVGAPSDAAAPAAATPDAAMTASQARSSLERGMAELGELSSRARQSGDMLRIACVQDKQDRASAVMEVATGDMLVLQDPAADAPTRGFAGEKLGESAQQMQGLVGQARACQGKEEAANGKSSNDAKAPQGVLPQDPTGGGPPASRGLPPIDPRPPVASPVL